MPRSGQNGLRRFVSRTWRPATCSVTSLTSAGSATRGMLQRFQLRRTLPMAHGTGDGRVDELAAGGDAPQHQAAAAHVAAADELGREHKALAEDRQQQIDVLA